MLQSLKWGTVVFFGLLPFLGGLFIGIYVPETEASDAGENGRCFGSVGVAEAVDLLIFIGFQCHQVLRSVS